LPKERQPEPVSASAEQNELLEQQPALTQSVALLHAPPSPDLRISSSGSFSGQNDQTYIKKFYRMSEREECDRIRFLRASNDSSPFIDAYLGQVLLGK
jgi:hypothetical protein